MKITGKLAQGGFHTFDADPSTHHGHKITRTWAVIADGKKALVYRKTEGGLELIADAEWGGSTIEPFDGHFFKISEGGKGHDSDPHNKKQNHADMVFIHGLVEWLDMAYNEHVFDNLILVAEPHTLGYLRKNLSSNVNARVTGELDKDLTKLSLKDTQEHLSHIMAF